MELTYIERDNELFETINYLLNITFLFIQKITLEFPRRANYITFEKMVVNQICSFDKKMNLSVEIALSKH